MGVEAGAVFHRLGMTIAPPDNSPENEAKSQGMQALIRFPAPITRHMAVHHLRPGDPEESGGLVLAGVTMGDQALLQIIGRQGM